MMNINWKQRLSNKWWWVFVITQIISISAYFGLDVTKYIGQDWTTLLGIILGLVNALGVSVDTSSNGLNDFQKVNEVSTLTTDVSQPIQSTLKDTSSAVLPINPNNIRSIGNSVDSTPSNTPS